MPNIHAREIFNDRRRELRKNATPQEKILWQHLRNSKFGFRFYRQHSIGPYIVDFFCSAKKLVIEIDGEQHKDNQEYDKARTKYLNSLNIRVIRFWNKDIKENFNGVLNIIEDALSQL